MQDRLAAWRRMLHQIPEVGMDLPNTLAYVKDRLNEMGVGSAQAGRCGLYALLGQGTAPSCSAPHAELRYLYFSSSNCPYNIVPLLPFRYPMKPDTVIFGGISSNMWIWSGLHIPLLPLSQHLSIRIIALVFSLLPLAFLLKYFPERYYVKGGFTHLIHMTGGSFVVNGTGRKGGENARVYTCPVYGPIRTKLTGRPERSRYPGRSLFFSGQDRCVDN